jgi:hypothetical protein
MLGERNKMNDEFDYTEEQKQVFAIDNDNLAEWALKKIKAETEERDRLLKIVEFEKGRLKDKEFLINKTYEDKTSFFMNKLADYFKTITPTETKTKTQKKYKLLSGELILKKQNQKYEYDENELFSYCQENDLMAFVEIKKSVKWGEFKKSVDLSKVKCIKTLEQPQKFEVKF